MQFRQSNSVHGTLLYSKSRYPNLQPYKVNHRLRLRKLWRMTMWVVRARMWRNGGGSSASTRRGRASSSTSWTGTGGRGAGQWAGWQGRVQVPGADRQRQHHPQHRLQVDSVDCLGVSYWLTFLIVYERQNKVCNMILWLLKRLFPCTIIQLSRKSPDINKIHPVYIEE